MKTAVKRILSLFLGISVLFCMACNASTTAEKAYSVVDAILTVAQSEVAIVPQADQAAYTNFVTLGETLNDQLHSCLTGASNSKPKLLACFNAYAVGLSSPTELTQLRILSPATQKKVQLYLTAIVTGVNVAVAAFGGTQSAPPAITQAPTKAELRQLSIDAGIDQQILATSAFPYRSW